MKKDWSFEKHTDFDLTQEQYIGYWVRQHGLKHKDLSKHPQIDDCIFLIKIRNSIVFNQFSRSEQASWGAIWNYVYHKQYPLKNKYINSMEQAVRKVLQRQENIKLLRNKIKQARQNPKPLQGDDDMTAKASPADTSVPWEV